MDNHHLEERLDQVEKFLVVVVAGAAGVLLVLGSLLPFLTETHLQTSEGDDRAYSLVTVLGDAQGGAETDDEGGSGNGTVIGVAGFAGLLACTVIAILVCLGTMWRDGRRLLLRTGQACVWLLGIGALVPIFLGLSAAEPDSSDQAGPAMFFYAAGIAVLGVLMFTSFRNLWVSDPELHRDAEAASDIPDHTRR